MEKWRNSNLGKPAKVYFITAAKLRWDNHSWGEHFIKLNYIFMQVMPNLIGVASVN